MKTFEEFVNESLNEGVISNLQIIAQDAGSFEQFVKDVIKEYPKLSKDKGAETWLREIYDEAVNESTNILFEKAVTIENMTFHASKIMTDKVAGIQFIPYGNTLDFFPEKERIAAITKAINSKVPKDIASLLHYTENKEAAGHIFALDLTRLVELIEKKFK